MPTAPSSTTRTASFNALPAAGSGASNTTATDTFTYTLTGGDTATVTITITGVDSDDTLHGTAGNDALTGGIGNDSYFVENSGDAINETAGQGTLDRVYASVSYVLGGRATISRRWRPPTRSAPARSISSGNELANRPSTAMPAINTLKGGGGNDVLLGLAGDDTLNGGAGDDRLYGGTGQNDMAGGTGQRLVHRRQPDRRDHRGGGRGHARPRVHDVNYTLTAGAHVEIMSPTTIFTGAINLTGNELANTIYGNNNINVLGGAAGNDVLAGLGGTDTLNGGDWRRPPARRRRRRHSQRRQRQRPPAWRSRRRQRSTAAWATTDWKAARARTTWPAAWVTTPIRHQRHRHRDRRAGQGSLDRVYTSVSFALAVGAQIEFLATSNIAGTTAINLTGNEFANTIYGNNGANVIAGKGGNDTLGGRGGADTFVFDTFAHTTANRDIIADFNGAQDTIRLAKSTFTKLTGNAGTTLSADQFVIGPDALDANDRILYSNGALIYDHNGNVAGGEQLIAVLSGRPTLSNTDILLG